ncbi:MAG: dTDP-4-dehydrorhamnose 3,5-epimerase family protein [Candidatus Gracilibacteria bacterium]|jgi:dTDP-4-dehydrorhamnose 3,5-epimerase
MIEGVKIKKLVKHCDDRGFFMEILRDDDKLMEKFGQTSFTITYPGVIKAFHYHKKQDDLWFVAGGMAQVVLYDLRKDSKSFKETQVIFAGDDNPVLILIPVGVAHGYKVLGEKPVSLFYHTTESYNNDEPDEERIDFDDKKIGFDWEAKNR